MNYLERFLNFIFQREEYTYLYGYVLVYPHPTFDKIIKDRKPCYTTARRRNDGQVEFILWKAGQQGHVNDFWHRMGDGHEKNFTTEQP